MNNHITKFGRQFRLLRCSHNETAQSVVHMLECSKSFLSKVEHGERAMPLTWIDKLTDHYKLTKYQQELLFGNKVEKNEIDTTLHGSLEINLKKFGQAKKDLAYSFAEKLAGLKKSQIVAIQKILNGETEAN